MTDNEIIKALEICIDFVSGGEVRCNDCPLHDCDNCSSEKLKSALDLINRQKEELDGQEVEIMNLKHEIEKKDTEIDILIRKKHALREEISELTAEVERLKTMHSEMCIGMKRLKTEAYREFAKKIKENILEVDVSFGYGKEHFTEVVAVVEIDNTLNELIGESK